MKALGRAAVAEWILKPLVTAGFVVVLGGALVVALSPQYSLSSLRQKFSRDHDRKLSAALLTELRAGGFTLFVRHASRDGIDVPGTTALDRAVLIDPKLVPPDFRFGLCLTEFGRIESQLLGHFLRSAKMPVGEVLASPLCRARETAELSVGRVDRMEPALVIDNVLASAGEKAARAEGLARLLANAPAKGSNRILFSHGGVLETQGFKGLSIEQTGMVILRHTAEGPKVVAIVPLREMLNALPSTLPTRPAK